VRLKDVLITVTSFFRDSEAWERLTSTVLKPLVRESSEDRPIRIWVAGCATGEEAYSVAISIFELLREADAEPHLEIFATDASDDALARARRSQFPAAAVEHLPEEFVDRWFDRTDEQVQIKPRVRDAIIFAPQKLTQDPFRMRIL
jgi:two-component system CheB/CheR fusion protein